MNGRFREERGSVTVWIMVVPVLLGLLGGVTLDMWAALSVRSRLAAVADDAAAAAAMAISEESLRVGAPSLDPARAREVAVAAVTSHPDAHRVSALTVTPTPGRVEVAITGTAPLHLLRAIGPAEIEMTVRGAAAPDVRDVRGG